MTSPINSINNFSVERPRLNSVRFVTRKEFTAFRAMVAVAALVGFVASLYFATKVGAAVSIIAFILAFLICPCINGFLKRHVWNQGHKSRLTPQMLEEIEKTNEPAKSLVQSSREQSLRTTRTEHSQTETQTDRTITPDQIEEPASPENTDVIEEEVVERPATIVIPNTPKLEPTEEKAALGTPSESPADSSRTFAKRCRRLGNGIVNGVAGLGTGISSAYQYFVSIRTTDEEPQIAEGSGESSPAHSDEETASPTLTPRHTPPQTSRRPLSVFIPETPAASPHASPENSPTHSEASDRSESQSPTPTSPRTPERTPTITPKPILKTPHLTPQRTPANVTFDLTPEQTPKTPAKTPKQPTPPKTPAKTPQLTPKTPAKTPKQPAPPQTPKGKTPSVTPERTPPQTPHKTPTPSPQPSPKKVFTFEQQQEQARAARRERERLIAELRVLTEEVRPLVSDLPESDQTALLGNSIIAGYRHTHSQAMAPDEQAKIREGQALPIEEQNRLMRAEETRLHSVIEAQKARKEAAKPKPKPIQKVSTRIDLSAWQKG